MDIQRIIHDGNQKLARQRLSDYLGIEGALDVELVGQTLTRIENSRPLISQADFEAYELAILLTESIPPIDANATSLQQRLEAIGDWITRPFPSLKRTMFSALEAR